MTSIRCAVAISSMSFPPFGGAASGSDCLKMTFGFELSQVGRQSLVGIADAANRKRTGGVGVHWLPDRLGHGLRSRKTLRVHPALRRRRLRLAAWIWCCILCHRTFPFIWAMVRDEATSRAALPPACRT